MKDKEFVTSGLACQHCLFSKLLFLGQNLQFPKEQGYLMNNAYKVTPNEQVCGTRLFITVFKSLIKAYFVF